MSELSRLPLAQLEFLLGEVTGGRAKCPLSAARLLALGLDAPSADTLLGALGELDSRASAAVLRAVIDERRSHRCPELQLVWTGPEPTVSGARDTAVVVRELFDSARRSVLVAGFRFDHGEDILRPLHRAMAERGVEARFFLNLGHEEEKELGAEACARAEVRRFLDRNWPFGEPRPRFFYDPRTAVPKKHISLHAKCVVVDERLSLVSSANFTDYGQDKNVEVGVRIDDRAFARLLVRQWNGGVSAGVFLPAVVE